MRRNTMLISRTLAAGLTVAMLLGACVSASDRYEQGLRLEGSGRSADAARRYIDALRRDPSLADARARLQESGDRAMADYRAEADAHYAAGNAAAAADALLELDALRRGAAAVSVQLAVPNDYASRRREMLDQALVQAARRSEDAAATGNYGEGLRLLERAAERWQPSAEQRRDLDEARLGIYLAWGEREARAGRYRAAYEVGERAIGALGRGFPGIERMLDLQSQAVEEGTIRVAVLPFTLSRNVQDNLPADFLRDVEDEMETEAWLEPPVFVAVLDPREVRRELRRRASGRPTTYEAANVGRTLGADLVVLMEIDSIRTTEHDVRTERRTAQLRGGADTAFTVRQGTRQSWLRVRYDVVDAQQRRVVGSDDFVAQASGRFREGHYAGNWRELMLQREDQALFDAQRRRQTERELRDELREALVSRLSGDVYQRILSFVH